MILDLLRGVIADLGGWAWVVLGLALLALELAVPGVLAFWIGLAALAVGVLTLLEPIAGWDWRAQAVVFVALSGLFAVIGRRMTAERDTGEGTRLNRPSRDLIGRTGTLLDAIEGGTGRAKLGDTLWRVEGPDLPAGTRVRVTGEAGGTLMVEPA